MSRPSISVVIPFAGDRAEARGAIEALLALETEPGDELILADNSATAPPDESVVVVPVAGERSPAHARNGGAQRARSDWILFIDADCRPEPDLLDAYFEEPIADDVGALAGNVTAAVEHDTLAGRYGAARGFLDQRAHLAHTYLPRAVAANLLVRRRAFEELGGFYEGVRAAEDTDFSWRLQRAGWRLEGRPRARVHHRYRATLRALRSQWRGYAAGRAWLSRRYEGFVPEPAVARAAARVRRRVGGTPARPRGAPPVTSGALERLRYLGIDVLLSAEELAGLTLSNRPRSDAPAQSNVVLVAGSFPERDDPRVELARTLDHPRVEAVRRPDFPDVEVIRNLQIDYREDDGAAARFRALAALFLLHPLRCALDVARRDRGGPPLPALAPAVRRLERDPQARVHPLGGGDSRATAVRMARLAGRPLDGTPR